MELVGRKVVHPKFGPGTITGLKNGVIRVFFDQFGSHSFRYPMAFADSLAAVESEVQAFVKRELEE